MNLKTLRHVLAVAAFALAATSGAAKQYVIPVVVPGVAGKNGSFWESEVRVIRLSGVDPVTIRRSWVALPGGGFVDDPATAPTWVIQWPSEQTKVVDMLILTGDQLLSGVAATHAAVGLDVEGAALVHWRSANTQGQERLPAGGLPVEECCWPGSGQFAAAFEQPLQGGSTIPWVTSGKDVFRTNLGLVNPSSTAARFKLRAYALDPWGSNILWSAQWTSAPLEVEVPAWGWRQIDDVFSVFIRSGCRTICYEERLLSVKPAFISITPLTEGEYFAYASVLYSPRNDPEFVPAVNVTVEGLPPDPPY